MSRMSTVRRQDVATQARKLRGFFEKERWSEAATALESVARMAQDLRKVDVSLLAQSLKTDLDNRMRHEEAAIFAEVSDRYEDLVKRLEHLTWAAGK